MVRNRLRVTLLTPAHDLSRRYVSRERRDSDQLPAWNWPGFGDRPSIYPLALADRVADRRLRISCGRWIVCGGDAALARGIVPAWGKPSGSDRRHLCPHAFSSFHDWIQRPPLRLLCAGTRPGQRPWRIISKGLLAVQLGRWPVRTLDGVWIASLVGDPGEPSVPGIAQCCERLPAIPISAGTFLDQRASTPVGHPGSGGNGALRGWRAERALSALLAQTDRDSIWPLP